MKKYTTSFNSYDSQIFLAFDYGTRNIGVAVGQKITGSATALTLLQARRGMPNWQEVDKLIQEWQPCALVVGMPRSLMGEDLPRMTHLTQKFIRLLQKRYAVYVYTVDEQLTTKTARAEIFAQGGYKALQNQAVDSVAAKIMLEEWLRKNISLQ